MSRSARASADPGPPTLTWWGHATTTIVDSGVRILTDPVLTARVAHLRRRRGPAPTAQARTADMVLISHLHVDHLHLPSLAQVDAPVVAPRGALSAVRALRRRDVIEVEAGDQVRCGDVVVHAVRADHDDRRHALAHRRAEPIGFVVVGQGRTYFAGDTATLAPMPAVVGACDVALAPVGGWGPGLGPGHLDPVGAADAVAALRPRLAVPIHFGTLWPIGLSRLGAREFLPPGADFVTAVRDRAPHVLARELRPGESIVLPRRPSPS